MAPKYGYTAPQLAHPEYNSPAINYDEANIVQQVVGTFLYYARVVDPKILVSLNTIAAQESKNTQEKIK